MYRKKARTLVICVLGLYALFLSWSLLQERINTKPYGYSEGSPVFFKAPLLVNTVQAFFAAIVGLVYAMVSSKQTPFAILWLSNDGKLPKKLDTGLIQSFVVTAITSSISSPVGYLLLKHVDYLVFLLAKSCKLLPVMLVHFVLYRTKFPPHKYLVAALVTGGVVSFTLANSSGKARNSINDGNTTLGMAQLLASMLLDGFTNSTQDQLFKSRAGSKHKLTGASMMCILNLFVCIITLAYTAVFQFDSVLGYAYRFFSIYPRAMTDMIMFALFGAVGQVFVFIILEKFDSLVLVTATVTRKMISMILSVFLFGHRLVLVQWFGVLMVFGGIGFESFLKLKGKPKPKAE